MAENKSGTQLWESRSDAPGYLVWPAKDSAGWHPLNLLADSTRKSGKPLSSRRGWCPVWAVPSRFEHFHAASASEGCLWAAGTELRPSSPSQNTINGCDTASPACDWCCRASARPEWCGLSMDRPPKPWWAPASQSVRLWLGAFGPKSAKADSSVC